MKNTFLSSAILAAAGVLTLGLTPAVANAATATQTATIAVSANVANTCTIAATPLAFGTYDPTAVKDATSTLTLQCTNTSPYNVGLNQGTATGATVTTRQMVNGANKLSYVITQDAGHGTNWGNTVGTDTVAGTGTGLQQTLTAYGEIAAGQFVNPVTYTDTVTATITY